MPVDLVTLPELKRHVRVTTDEQDDLLALYLDQAQAIILKYIERDDEDWTAEIDAWDDETVPGPVKAAIMLQAAELYRMRGDTDPPRRDHGYPHPQIVAMLHQYRDPTVA